MSPVNPFARPVIDDPREAKASVESIHLNEFEALIGQFEQLNGQEIPRLAHGPLTQLVLSQNAGIGKSHLLGRLLHALKDKAVWINLRANQDRTNLWRRMLQRTIQELERPADQVHRVLKAGMPSQLDCMARHILSGLLLTAARDGILPIHAETAQDLRLNPVGMLGNEVYGEYLLKFLDLLLPIASENLANAGIDLDSSASAWLSALIHYTTHDLQHPDRRAALAWIGGSPIEQKEATNIGLTLRDLPTADSSEESRNEECFRRIKDLCALASFYRPFVFAFDQTELYGQTAELAKAFGAMLARLQAECINQLTLVTANEAVWIQAVYTKFDTADQQKFNHPIVKLSGISNDQAKELVEFKLKDAGHDAERVREIFSAQVFTDLYLPGKTLPSPREVEQAAGKVITTPPPPADIKMVFEDYRQRLLSTPGETEIDAAVLHWVMTIGLSALEGVEIQPGFKSIKGYLDCRWDLDEKRTLFGVLEESGDGRVWAGVKNEYLRYAQDVQRAGRKSFGVGFWHVRLPKPSAGMRNQIELAKPAGFKLLTLSDQDAAELYAGQAMYADIVAGNLTSFSEADLVKFLSSRLAGWKEKLTEPSEPPPSPPPIKEIREIVRRMRGLTWSVLNSRLQDINIVIELDTALLACQQLEGEVRVFITPANHFFSWQPRLST